MRDEARDCPFEWKSDKFASPSGNSFLATGIHVYIHISSTTTKIVLCTYKYRVCSVPAVFNSALILEYLIFTITKKLSIFNRYFSFFLQVRISQFIVLDYSGNWVKQLAKKKKKQTETWEKRGNDSSEHVSIENNKTTAMFSGFIISKPWSMKNSRGITIKWINLKMEYFREFYCFLLYIDLYGQCICAYDSWRVLETTTMGRK